MNQDTRENAQNVTRTTDANAAPNAAPEHPYRHWNRERLTKEVEARGISVREGAEPREYADALLMDDEAGGAKIRQDNTPPPQP